MTKNTDIAQAGKFLLAGIFTNLISYLAYFLLTAAGMGYKTAMTGLYVLGMLLSYTLNKQWTFASNDTKKATKVRFLIAYIVAYMLNLLSMFVAVEYMNISHYLVQAVNIVVISSMLFITQKYWIFVDRAVVDSAVDCNAFSERAHL